MGIIDANLLKGNLDGLAASLTKDPSTGFVMPKVSTALVEDVRAVSVFTQYGSEFEFRCDESEGRGGRGEAPSPLRYLLSSLAFCQQVWYAKGAAMADCEIEALEINVETFMDMRGEHLVGEIPTYPQWFLVDARVDSPSSVECVKAMVAEANRRCPVYGLLSRAVPIYSRLVHNGVVLEDETPPGPPDLTGEK